MQPITQNMPDSFGYIKCGEILKSRKSFQDSYLLQCIQCKEIYLLLESFIFHLDATCKRTVETKNYQEGIGCSSNKDELASESLNCEIEQPSVKLEKNNVQMDDPLIVPKNENSNENSLIKVEPTNIQEIQMSQYNIEQLENSNQDENEDSDGGETSCISEDECKSEIDSENNEVNEVKENLLIPVICEIDKEKEDPVTDELKTSISDYDIEQCNESEEVSDSSDDFQPDDSESDKDSDEITKAASSKKTMKLSPVIKDFMQSKSNVTTLIDLYKNQVHLWKKDSPFYRVKDKRKQFLEEITQELNNKQNLKLTCNEITEIISRICRQHQKDLKRLQCNKTKLKKSEKKHGKYDKSSKRNYKCSWYFEQLSFLRSQVIIRLQNIDSNLPELTPETIIKILEIYKNFPHLWNTYLIENICSNKRHDAYIEMLNVLDTEMNLKISVNALEEYIRTIHNYFSKEKRQRLDSSKQNEQENKVKNDTKYYEHMSFLEHHEGPFYCSECSGTFTKPLCYRVHKSRHDGTIPLICSQCKQEFKSVASYTSHAKRHLEDLQFVCKECGMKFLRHSDLKLHMLIHTDARSFCCDICGASYRHNNSFRRHLRRHENRFSHTCHICSKGYYSKHRYIDHMNSHMNIRSHICKVCEKAFITSKALKAHMVTHEDARNHACSLCGKTFKLKIGVLQHMRTHGSKV